jgi:folate-binding protein YgfZ
LNSLLPPALSLEQLPAIAFDKGCYPGQEMVARLHYRGGHKRHLHRAEVPAHVSAGTAVFDDDRDVGQLLDAYVECHASNGQALLVLNDDATAAFHRGALKTSGGDRIAHVD